MQETESKARLSTALESVQVEPLYLTAFPEASTAMQKLELVHETDFNALVPSPTLGEADQLVPLKMAAWPEASTAMQKVELMHDTELIVLVLSAEASYVQPVPL